MKNNFWKDKIKSYKEHPGSLIVMLLVMLSAIITFAVLIFLIVYILVHGVPYLKPSVFSLTLYIRECIVDAGVDQYGDYDTAITSDRSTIWYFQRSFLWNMQKRGNKFG